MKAFLSHSSKDKVQVRRIMTDLKSHHIDCWIDEEEIPFGGSIPDYIEKGINESDIILLFLSKYSVLSGWVKTEWQAKLFEQINENKILVIPILLEKCDIPTILQPMKYVDFSISSEYETSLSGLLHQLKKEISNVSDQNDSEIIESVYQFTSEIIEELKSETISFPAYKKLKIVESLSKIPRSGKFVRLKNFKPSLEIRNVYDHIHSVAHIADTILPCIEHGLKNYEFAELARVVAFHELNEVILGDIPTYTELSNRKRNSSRIFAEDRLRTVTPYKRERIANDLIWMFLSEKHRKSMGKVTSHLRDKNSKVRLIFKCFDKIDPIIATWRYLHVYRTKLGEDAAKFVHVMKDFFENPDVLSFLSENKLDTKLYDLVAALQTRNNALEYYKDPDYLEKMSPMLGIPSQNLRMAIEGIPLSVKY
ncbi:MAG: hypothetical protein COB36_14885 [Alphaproteobacteria bacterium]|nr:MAG: hypothetical protein COB36_14885 [Alphaproteobacteria bacterium]